MTALKKYEPNYDLSAGLTYLLKSLNEWFTSEQILNLVSTGQIPLTTALYRDHFHFEYAYKLKAVSDWIKNKIASAQVFEEPAIKGSKSEWYLLREEEIFGPLCLDEITELKTSKAFGPEDLFFAPSRDLVLNAQNIGAGHNEPSIHEKFFFNRKETRAKANWLANVKYKGAVYTGVTLDVSLCSVSLYLKESLVVGEIVKLDMTASSDNQFLSVEAEVVTAVPSGDGTRCGLKLVNLSEAMKKSLRNFISGARN